MLCTLYSAVAIPASVHCGLGHYPYFSDYHLVFVPLDCITRLFTGRPDRGCLQLEVTVMVARSVPARLEPFLFAPFPHVLLSS
jgi:hypothetical protein